MTDEPTGDAPATPLAEGELPPAPEELAFDVAELPGGALAALEAVLMVADEPVPAVRLATVLGLPTGDVVDLLRTAASTADARAGSSCGRSARAGGSTRRPRTTRWRAVS